MQLSCHISEYETSGAPVGTEVHVQTLPGFIRHVLRSEAQVGAQWGFAVAAWTDQIENEIMWIGLGTFIALTGTEIGLEIADLALE